MVPNGYTSEHPLPYWSNPPFFLIFDILALWRSGLSAREPECQKFLKNGGLDQCGPERFGRLIFLQSGKCGTERDISHVDQSNVHAERVDVAWFCSNFVRIHCSRFNDLTITRHKHFKQISSVVYVCRRQNHETLQWRRTVDNK